MKNLFTFFLSLLLYGSVYAGDTKHNASIKILFIGNSFTHMNEMPKLFKKIAKASGKDVLVEYNTKAGGDFKIHSKRKDLYKAINRRDWDYVILQGNSLEFMYDTTRINSKTTPYLEQILDSIKANSSETNMLFYMTWGYAAGYSKINSFNSFDKMTKAIVNGYRYISDKYAIPIVPVGQVWSEVRKNSDINLYAKDKFHPNKNGSYLIASTFYSAIFREPTNHLYTSNITPSRASYFDEVSFDFIRKNGLDYGLINDNFKLSFNIHDGYRFTILSSTALRDVLTKDYNASFYKDFTTGFNDLQEVFSSIVNENNQPIRKDDIPKTVDHQGLVRRFES